MLSVIVAVSLALGSPTGDEFGGLVDQGKQEATVWGQGSAEPEDNDAAGRGAGASDEKPPLIYVQANPELCGLTDLDYNEAMLGGICGQDVVAIECPPDSYPMAAIWVQRLLPDGTYSRIDMLADQRCITPADLAAEAQRAFASMAIPTPTATLQNGWDRLLVNAYYPVYTDAAPLTQQTTLIEVPVEIRAVPDRFVWDFDDPFSPGGGTLTTTDLGAPWQEGDEQPDEDWVAHAWTGLGDPGTAAGYAAGARWTEDRVKYRVDVTVTLATTWHGQFRIAGSPTWTDIPGEITTNSTAGTWTVTEARSKLVCDDLNGDSSC